MGSLDRGIGFVRESSRSARLGGSRVRNPRLGRDRGHPAEAGTGIPMIGRTSTDPPNAAGQRAAASNA